MKSSKEEIVAFLEKEFPQSLEHCTIESVTSKAAVVYYHVDQRHQRPGGTISGPTMMTLADFALYIVKLLYYSYKIRKKLEITHRLSRST
ncbi:hypothetical protein ABTP83_16780, partial [Acinetobacter baumannii]